MKKSPHPARRGRARVMWPVSYGRDYNDADHAYATLERAQRAAEDDPWKPSVIRVTVQPAPARKK
jgi:hypothetical protein